MIATTPPLHRRSDIERRVVNQIRKGRYCSSMRTGAGRAPYPGRLAVLGGGALVLWMLLAQVTRAAGEEPDLMQTLIAQDATLNNNLTLIEPRWQKNAGGRTLELGFGFEKMLSPRLDIEVGGQWDSISQRGGPDGTAFGDIDVALKYVFFKGSEFQIALAPQLSFPTASRILDEPTEVHAGGYLSWGGRLGSLSEYGWPRYLQAIELQGDLGYSHGFGSGGSDEIFFDPVLDYSMPYLGYSTGIRTPWPMRNLCVFSELNFNQPLSGGDDRSLSLFVTPGVAYISEKYQTTVGVQLPLTNAAEKSAQIAVVGSFTIFMDQLSPRFGWTPF
jgi:hypothetical protein